MENRFMSGLVNYNNLTYTENGALTHRSTGSDLYDMFALGGAMRVRSDEDVILMFRKAFNENPVYAMKCLFYLRDVRGGQGERRFFRVCLRDLAQHNTEPAKRNLKLVPEFGRWDDLYVFDGTPLEKDAYAFMREQLALDISCKTPSLLGKWLKSENTSSHESRRLGMKTRKAFGMTPKQYRKVLSALRGRINVLERLMSAGQWDKIEFDKIPSKAGLIYKNAFARHDLERVKAQPDAITYDAFMKDENTKVNAGTLYPYDVVHKAIELMGYNYYSYYRSMSKSQVALDNIDRLAINKYWDNLKDYFNGAKFNGMAVVDTSGSMSGTPMEVAISLGMYCAQNAVGPFADHFFTFSDRPSFLKVEGVDFCDKVYRITGAPWGGSTNVEAVFDQMLNIAIQNHCSQSEIPENVIVISDMEFNNCVRANGYGGVNATLFENIAAKWKAHGYEMPKLIFWNVQARQNNIPMKDDGRVTYVSGMSASIFETLLSGKTGWELMMEKLDSPRYSVIR